jgi:hypothetical protein
LLRGFYERSEFVRGDCEGGTTELVLLFFNKFPVVTVTLVGTKLPLTIENENKEEFGLLIHYLGI